MRFDCTGPSLRTDATTPTPLRTCVLAAAPLQTSTHHPGTHLNILKERLCSVLVRAGLVRLGKTYYLSAVLSGEPGQLSSWTDLTLRRWAGDGYAATTAEAMLSDMLFSCMSWCFQIRATLLSASSMACGPGKQVLQVIRARTPQKASYVYTFLLAPEPVSA